MTRDEYLRASEQELLAECQVDCYRASGPGGQKRNKTDSAVRLRHGPTGLTVVATESRSQHENKARALRRLRMAVALELRVNSDGSIPSVLTAFAGPTEYLCVNLKNPKYPLAVAGVLDALSSAGCRVSEAAAALGVTTSKLIAFFKRDSKVWARVNKLRQAAGVAPLR